MQQHHRDAIERWAEAVLMSLILFREWPQAGCSTQFMLDSEWN